MHADTCFLCSGWGSRERKQEKEGEVGDSGLGRAQAPTTRSGTPKTQLCSGRSLLSAS